jgi:hypothetical protein
MYEWFRKQAYLTQVILVMVALVILWTALQLVLTLIRMLLPIAILAMLIVGGLWLYDKVKND